MDDEFVNMLNHAMLFNSDFSEQMIDMSRAEVEHSVNGYHHMDDI